MASRRLPAILWFIASALCLVAALVAYTKNGRIKWSLFAASVFLATMGLTMSRPPKSGSD